MMMMIVMVIRLPLGIRSSFSSINISAVRVLMVMMATVMMVTKVT